MKNTISVIGKSKTGKTNILFNEVSKKINDGDNLLILDTKLEYYNHFYNELKNNGYKIQVVNLSEPLKSDGWNPLSYPFYIKKAKKNDDYIDVLEQMGHAIFYEENDVDPFWEKMATNLFIGLSLILMRIDSKINSCELKDKLVAYFPTIMLLLDTLNEKDNTQDKTILKKYIETLQPMDPAYITLSTIAFAPNETRDSIISVFKSKMNIYIMREQLVNSFLFNSFSEAKISTELDKTAIFVVGHPQLNSLTNLLINNCLNELNMEKERRNVSFILDGFDNLPSLYNFKGVVDYFNNSDDTLYITINDKEMFNKKYNINVDSLFDEVIKCDSKCVAPSSDEKDMPLPELTVGTVYSKDYKDILRNYMYSLMD